MTSFPMNAGDGVYSYSKNSQLQKEMIDGAKEMVIDAIIQKLDIKTILASSNTFHITELGCSVGPNTFSAMQYIVEALKDKLFPSRSIHFVHSSSGIKWLSKIPKELVDEKSPAWNKGLIHYVGASNVEVVNAYFAQFEKDMEIFFNVRAEEIVQGGMMVLITAFSGYIRLLKFFGSSLMDLANEGKLDESLVDSFNLPLYYPSPQDMTKVVRKNGLFSIERMELINIKSNLVDEADAKTLMMSLRSSLEGVIINHFGSKIGEEACARTILKSEEISEWMKVNYEKPSILFVALKRK